MFHSPYLKQLSYCHNKEIDSTPFPPVFLRLFFGRGRVFEIRTEYLIHFLLERYPEYSGRANRVTLRYSNLLHSHESNLDR